MDNILVEEKKITDNITMAVIREINQRSEQKKQETKARQYSEECRRREMLHSFLAIVCFIAMIVIVTGIVGAMEIR